MALVTAVGSAIPTAEISLGTRVSTTSPATATAERFARILASEAGPAKVTAAPSANAPATAIWPATATAVPSATGPAIPGPAPNSFFPLAGVTAEPSVMILATEMKLVSLTAALWATTLVTGYRHVTAIRVRLATTPVTATARANTIAVL